MNLNVGIVKICVKAAVEYFVIYLCMYLRTIVMEKDSWESLGLQGDQTSQS